MVGQEAVDQCPLLLLQEQTPGGSTDVPGNVSSTLRPPSPITHVHAAPQRHWQRRRQLRVAGREHRGQPPRLELRWHRRRAACRQADLPQTGGTLGCALWEVREGEGHLWRPLLLLHHRDRQLAAAAAGRQDHQAAGD